VDQQDWLQGASNQGMAWEWIVLEGFRFPPTQAFPQNILKALAPGGQLLGFCPLHGQSSRISHLLEGLISDDLYKALNNAEESFFQDRTPLPQKEEFLTPELQSMGLELELWEETQWTEKITVDMNWLQSWTQSSPKSWAVFMEENLESHIWDEIRTNLTPERFPKDISWTRKWLIYKCKNTNLG
jgi:hypothetical protein